MKIERISENQIRCTLTSGDLSSRNINLIELAYGTEKARKLFREMIQRASSEVDFDAEDIPLMVEAIPLANESIMLVITKVEDPEELDTRFAKFSPLAEDSDSPLSQIAGELLEGADSGLELPAPDASGESSELLEGQERSALQAGGSKGTRLRIFRFDQLDQVAEAARALNGVYDGSSTLYKKPGTHQYYLLIRRGEDSSLAFSRACNILAEYAARFPGEYASEAYFEEHYDKLVGEHAIQNLAKL